MDSEYFYRIGVPLGTRLSLIVRHPGFWRVWTALANPHATVDQYHGTYLELHDNGAVFRVTVHEDGTFDQLQVKGVDT